MSAKVRFSEELISERQQQLQRFLERVMQHPEIHDSPSLNTFLTADYNVWETTKKQGSLPTVDAPKDLQLGDDSEEGVLETNTSNDPGTPTQKTSSSGIRIATWLGKKVSQTRMAMGGLQLESTPDDDLFNDLTSYANNIDSNIKILAKDATLLVAATKTQAEKMEHMAAAFSEMGEYKLDNEVIVRTSSSTMYSKLGHNWSNLSKLTNFAHMSGQVKLDEPIQDLARDVQALQKAISQRKDALLEYTRKALQGKTKMGQLDKLRENAGGNPDKIAALEVEVKAVKEEGAELWKQVDTISKRLQRDAERFKINFHQTMRITMETFHKVQVEYSQKYIQGWGDVLPYLAPVNMGAPMAPPPSSFPPEVPKGDEPFTVSL